MWDERGSRSWAVAPSFWRSFRPPCRRCGRGLEAPPSPANAGERMCAGCLSSDRARCLGSRGVNYSPFRPLSAVV